MRTSIRGAVALLLITLSAAACGSDGPMDPSELTYAPWLGVNLSQMIKTKSGLYYQDEVVGSGRRATYGDSVTVHYTLWLHDGQLIDSSYAQNEEEEDEPLTIPGLGLGWVIPGFDEGVLGMKEGGRRLLVVPSKLGYGSHGTGRIPGHATLVYRVDLLSVVPD